MNNHQMALIKQENAELRDLLNGALDEKGIVPIDDHKDLVTADTRMPAIMQRTFVMKELAKGTHVKEIREMLRQEYGMTAKRASNYVDAIRYYLKNEYIKYQEEVAYNNVTTLRQILKDSMDRGDNKTAIAAIQELNRMCAVYESSTTIESDGPVKIEFRG